MARTIGAYKSYSFIDKDPIIDAVRTAVQDSGKSISYIEVHSGVTRSTLKNWFEGKTRRPQHATVMAVLKCIGYDLKLVKVSAAVNLKVVGGTRG